MRGEINKLAAFLRKSLSPDDLNKISHHLHIDQFKGNDSVNYETTKDMGFIRQGAAQFVRKGKTGDWKNHFSPELNDKIDQWIDKNLAGTNDLKFFNELEDQD